MPAPDNIYENDVDFTILALQYPDFAKRLKPNRQLDFSDPESVRQLTKCLLHRDFDLSIDLPEDRLCPPVPNRFNYILFIQSLLDSTSPSFHQGFDPERQVIGLDIGTGASAIYPLLACRQRSQWRFLATEIDEKNREYAQRNILANKLQARIRLIDTDDKGDRLIPTGQLQKFDRIDILLTNPPFYPSTQSLLDSAHQKSRPPNSSCTGSAVEMITPGGEIGFVSKIIAESLLPANQRKIQWFSAMLGKLSSVGAVVERLRESGSGNYTVAEFIQGQRTRRWCVAWSWMGYRPAIDVARSVGSGSGVERKLLPAVTEMEFETELPAGGGCGGGGGGGLGSVLDKVCSQIQSLDGEGVHWKVDCARGVGMFMSRHGDVWSRKARRRKRAESERESGHEHEHESRENRIGNEKTKTDADAEMEDENDHDTGSADEEPEPEPEPDLVVRISITPSPGSAAGGSAPLYRPSQHPHPPSTRSARTSSTCQPKTDTDMDMDMDIHEHGYTHVYIHMRHLQGHDPVLFESFCGWLKRRVTSPAPVPVPARW
ncbi:uncharacterized protein Z519_04749 [Cladophialophora bantiana CBS 173.52]|uniref:U6 small nuclear RNA (adenine-(43)-N(6))-methyltransferase n=1 Tax=Cladophialophora bantiana (strain ATCC 10958 / CBS 173.52 / CDC B-1940 / NIH 8579) TaxID=1442370 RepID=A0A0D2G7Z1_CLAB1|nr:uncharacterized protein Z519_04749 [Cladophialophora bantiana CBS 173.52]KIW94772.1 hypothetical protein Z519_04749 [Cladophialophora bantiana CBS 173.52]